MYSTTIMLILNYPMEQEIDELFMDNLETSYTEKTIKELEQNTKRLTQIKPYVSVIKEYVSSIDTNIELYNIKLERLAKKMEEIENENTKLENEIMYQTSIYDRLRDLLIHLEIKEEHFINLEIESFDTPEGIATMEQSFDALCNFEVQEYTIRVVQEKRVRVEKACTDFIKRLIQVVTEICNKTEPSQFGIHNSLYNKLSSLQKLFEICKKFPLHEQLGIVYTRRVKELYITELSEYLKNLYKINDKNKNVTEIRNTIDTVLETYRATIQIENNFLQKMSIGNKTEAIFLDTNSLIVKFLQDIGSILEFEVIIFFNNNIQNVQQNEKVYFDLQEHMKVLLGKMKKTFLQKEAEYKNTEHGIQRYEKYVTFIRLNHVQNKEYNGNVNRSQNDENGESSINTENSKNGNSNSKNNRTLQDLENILFRINMSRVLRQEHTSCIDYVCNKVMLDHVLYVYNNMTQHNTDLHEYDDAIKTFTGELEKAVLTFVFEESTPMKQIAKVAECIHHLERYKSDINQLVFDMVKSNFNDKENIEAANILKIRN